MTTEKIEPNDIIASLKRMGLNADHKKTDEKSSPSYELLLKNYKIAQDFNKTFATVTGQKVLDALMDESLRKISWHWAAENSDQAMMYGLLREGQNSMMKYILKQIVLAQEGPPVKKAAGKTAK